VDREDDRPGENAVDREETTPYCANMPPQENAAPRAPSWVEPSSITPLGYVPDDAPEESDDALGDILALSDTGLYADVTWYLYRIPRLGQAGVTKPARTGGPKYCARFTGALDIEHVRETVGGGLYRIAGTRRGQMFFNRRFEIDGPEKVIDQAPTAPSAPSEPSGEISALRLEIQALTKALGQRTETVSSPSVGSGMSLIEILELVKHLTPPQRNGDAAMVETMLKMVEKGISLGEAREPGKENGWATAIQSLGPLLERIVTARQQPRRGPAAPGPARPVASAVSPAATQSRAEVVDENPRMTAVIDALANGIENEIPPADLAITAATILRPLELTMLRSAGVDGILAELEILKDRYPVFGGLAVRPYLEALFAELSDESEE
jgi:hypothetical protein